MDDIVDSIPSDACGSDGEADYVESPESPHSPPLEFGMEFDSDEHAISYYRKYSGSLGFNIRKEYVNRNKTGIITSRKLTCCREGFRGKDRRDAFVKNPRKDTRTGCLAHIVISRDQSSGKYRVTSFEAEHNHPLAPKGTDHMSPSKRKAKKLRAHAMGLEDDFGIQASESKIKVQALEFMGFIDKDQSNYLRTKRQRDMKLGDAGNMIHYFEKRRLEDPSFFFAMQLDANDLITNIFWADAKMIVDYKLFGDVVSVDTTYMTNRNYRPFAIFVGMNHCKKMVIFGAALMYDETVESFRWLLETFLKAMSGRNPKTILTAQDAAISKAISLVMPDAYHRLCVWLMEQEAVKHLNHVLNGSDSFGKDFYKCIYEVEGEEEFLNAWEVMLDKYDLRDNDWVKGIFDSREKWAMVYGRNVFSGGLRNTQLSENFINALKDDLKFDMDLLQFFDHFERAVDDKRYKDLEASHDMIQRLPRLNVELPLLIHARDVYTPVIFEMFQDEWAKSLLVVVNSHMEDGLHHIYKVSTVSLTQEHTVVAKSTDAIASCSCKKFEYVGILCSHALKILDIMNVKLMIPSHYILKRWTKDARVRSVEVVDVGDTEEDPVSKVANRYRNLCPTFVQIAARASESKAAYEVAAKYANELAAKLEAIIKAENSSGAPATPSTALEGLDISNNQLNMVDNADVPSVTRSTWQSHVMESDFPVLVEFWASWSSPCLMSHPIVAKLSKVYESRLKCFKLDTDESPEIATQYGIRSIPTIIIFKNGEKKDMVVGVVSENTLIEWIEKFLGAVSWFSLFRN